MKEQLAKIKAEALAAFEGAQAAADLDALRVKYLGKKGELTPPPPPRRPRPRRPPAQQSAPPPRTHRRLKANGRPVRRGAAQNGTACQ